MKTIKFLLNKIIVVEVMLILLYFITIVFNIHITIFDLFIIYGLKFLTPVAIFSIIPYIILSIFDNKIIEVAVGVVLGGLILYYLFRYIGVI